MTAPRTPASSRAAAGRSAGLRAAASVLLLLLSAAPAQPAAAPAEAGAAAMVVSPSEEATLAGVAVLRRGGNAVDAAVATALALAVTWPHAGNLAGGGFMLVRTPGGEHLALDFRETAPAALRAEAFLDEDGRPVPGLSLRGGLAVGVPGSVAGLHEAHRRWGRLRWRDLVRPAERLAARGFPVSEELGRRFADHGGKLLDDPAARAAFAPDGRLPEAGERLVQRDLAASLRRLARQGPEGFYEGPVAEAVVAAVERAGGVLSLEDLAGYRPVLPRPLTGEYRGHRVVAFPPPSSGVLLLQMLALLERFDLREFGPGASQTVHWMAEVERRAYADRARWLGDPAFWDAPVAGLLDGDYLDRRAATIAGDRATPSAEVRAGQPPRPESPDTVHLSAADAEGGAVALTTTLNLNFGAGLMAPGTGILLNNEIDDFALAPGIANEWGLLGSVANAVEPGKRPLSSMTPAMVEPPGGGPRPLLVLGSPGGSKIITSVLQVIVNVVDHGMPLQEAVNSPRFHHQWQPDVILHEAGCFPLDVERALLARGHRLERAVGYLGNVNAIGLDAAGGWLGAADPRRRGLAAGF